MPPPVFDVSDMSGAALGVQWILVPKLKRYAPPRIATRYTMTTSKITVIEV
jgi:hypothetical protein